MYHESPCSVKKNELNDIVDRTINEYLCYCYCRLFEIRPFWNREF